MADITKLARVTGKGVRDYNLTENTLVSDNLKLLLGSANNSIHATFSGSLTAARTIAMPDANVDLGHISALYSLSGVSAGDTNLGTFTGSTIADNSSIKAALQALETSLESTATNKANVNLDNLSTGQTQIPANVQLNSLNTSQTIGSEFELRTSDQTTSISGAIRIRSGNVSGSFASGGTRMISGFNTNATVAATALATGFATVGSGDISGGSSGRTANASLISGSITGARTHDAGAGGTANGTGVAQVLSGSITVNGVGSQGNTGLALLASGSISSINVTGKSGDAALLSGNSGSTGVSYGGDTYSTGFIGIRSGEASGTGRSGEVGIFSGRAASAVSGRIVIQSGAVTNAAAYPGAIDSSASTVATGTVELASGRIDNVSSSAATGNVTIQSGNHAGSGNSGNVSIFAGTVNSGTRGIVSLNGLHIDVNSKQIKNLADPTAAQDAATKAYVDAVAEGLRPKEAVRAATTAAGTLASDFEAGDSIDGVTLVAGDRILIKDQATASQNGIYVVQASGAPVRASDFDSLSPIDEINGAYVAVQEGTANAGKLFVQTGAVSSIGVDDIDFVFFNSVSGLVGGDGITVSGSNISVDHDGEGLAFSAGQLALELDGSTLSKSASGLKLSDTAVSAGSYGSSSQVGSFTVDAQGRLTAASDVSIDHDALLNFSANEHVDHSAVQIATAADSGLTGGGDITATRNLSVDINGTTAETSADNADKILIWDNSASALKSMTRGNFLSGLQTTVEKVEVLADAGESLTAGLKAMRWALGAETAGRMYRADNDASTTDNFYVAALFVAAGTETAGTPITAVKSGKLTATSHGFTVGAPIFLGASGALTNTAPTATDTAVVRVGIARDANTIDVDIQVVGIN